MGIPVGEGTWYCVLQGSEIVATGGTQTLAMSVHYEFGSPNSYTLSKTQADIEVAEDGVVIHSAYLQSDGSSIYFPDFTYTPAAGGHHLEMSFSAQGYWSGDLEGGTPFWSESVGGSTTFDYTAGTVTAPTISNFVASPATVVSGNSTQLSWTLGGSLASVTLSDHPYIQVTSPHNVTPTSDTTYTLTAENSAGIVTSTVNVAVSLGAGGGNYGVTLSASPSTIAAGQSTTLTWSVSDTTNLKYIWIFPGDILLPISSSSGSCTVTPFTDTTYSAVVTTIDNPDRGGGVVTGAFGSNSCAVTVTGDTYTAGAYAPSVSHSGPGQVWSPNFFDTTNGSYAYSNRNSTTSLPYVMASLAQSSSGDPCALQASSPYGLGIFASTLGTSPSTYLGMAKYPSSTSFWYYHGRVANPGLFNINFLDTGRVIGRDCGFYYPYMSLGSAHNCSTSAVTGLYFSIDQISSGVMRLTCKTPCTCSLNFELYTFGLDDGAWGGAQLDVNLDFAITGSSARTFSTVINLLDESPSGRAFETLYSSFQSDFTPSATFNVGDTLTIGVKYQCRGYGFTGSWLLGSLLGGLTGRCSPL